MRASVTLKDKDVIKCIAEHYGVKEEDVIKSKYSYTVLFSEISEEKLKEVFSWH